MIHPSEVININELHLIKKINHNSLVENGDFNQQQWQHNDDQAFSAAGSGEHLFSINLTLET